MTPFGSSCTSFHCKYSGNIDRYYVSFSVIRIKPADRNDKVSGISHMVLLLHNYDAVHAAMQSIKEIYGGSSSVVSVTDLVFDFTVAAPKDWPQEAAAVHNQTCRMFTTFSIKYMMMTGLVFFFVFFLTFRNLSWSGFLLLSYLTTTTRHLVQSWLLVHVFFFPLF